MGESFRQGIEKDDRERHRGEEEAEAVDEVRRGNEEQRADHAGRDRGTPTQELVASLRAGIALIDLPVGDAVEGHGGRSRKDHAEQDQAKNPPTRKPIGRHNHRAEREGERKDRAKTE